MGGFQPRFGFGGEEELLALDLAAAGWQLVYAPELVAHHHPSLAHTGREKRQATVMRNALWSAWLRRSASVAVARTVSVAGASLRCGQPGAVLGAVRALPWALRNRCAVPPEVERAARRLE